MSDLSTQVRTHLAQCHREDDSERLLRLTADELDRLSHELEATKEAARSRMARAAVTLNGEGEE